MVNDFKRFLDRELSRAGLQLNPLNTSGVNASIDNIQSTQALVGYLGNLANEYYSKSLMLRGLNISRITPEDWNKVYPYSFVILEAISEGRYVIVQSSGKGSKAAPSILKIDLPINPQNLQITTHFASNLSVASRGILEEHNGINVKQLSFTATTGILVNRKSFTLERKTSTDLQAVFGGTLQTAATLRNSLEVVFPSARNQNSSPPISNEDLLFTGYYQFHLIRAFLEAYAALKRTADGRKYRLGFQIHKDNVTYLVTPQQFTVNRSATAPLEYLYSFQGIIWGSINNASLRASNNPLAESLTNKVSDLQAILNRIRGARRVLQVSKELIQQFKIDVETSILGPINNIILTLKEALSLPITVLDMPKDLASAFNILIAKEIQTILQFLPAGFQSKWSTYAEQLQLSALYSKPTGDDSLSGGDGGGLFKSTGVGGLFDPDFFDEIPLSALPMGPELQETVNNIIEEAANTTNTDVENLINNLQQLSDVMQNFALTQGADSYAWDILNSIYTTIAQLYALLADNFYGDVTVSEQSAGVNPLLDFFEEYIEDGGGEFQKPKGKFAVPLPFGVSLEWLAQKYLGDATRWHEIVAANNLQPPYIDEEGFVRKFLTNGSGNKFIIDSIENLYVNQPVWLFSDTISAQKRKIKAIQKIAEGQYLITVSGQDNLDQFLLAHNAQMKAYLPHTVNSQQPIYIPIDSPSNLDSTNTRNIGYIEESPELLAMSKIDLLLDQNGDLAITPNGHQNLAYGKINIIQAAKLKLETALGSLLLHPDYGAGAQVGDSEADFELNSLIQGIRQSFLSDPRFDEITSFEVVRESGVLKIRLNVLAAGTATIVPLEFNLAGVT